MKHHSTIIRVGKKEVVVFSDGDWRTYRRASQSSKNRLKNLSNMSSWQSVHENATFITPLPEKKP